MSAIMRRRLVCRCGWTHLEPIESLRSGSTGWERIYRTIGLGFVAGVHQLADIFEPGRHAVRAEHQLSGYGVTVTIEADTTAYEQQLADAVERIREARWQMKLHGERLAARRWLDRLVARTYADLGLERAE